MRKRSWTPWQRKALGAELFNLSEFSMRLALSLGFEDSRRRLELRLRGGVRSRSSYRRGCPPRTAFCALGGHLFACFQGLYYYTPLTSFELTSWRAMRHVTQALQLALAKAAPRAKATWSGPKNSESNQNCPSRNTLMVSATIADASTAQRVSYVFSITQSFATLAH
jgi:hypothetical protein